MHYDTPFNNIFENGIVAPRIYFAADGSAKLEYSTSVLTLTGAQFAFPDGTAAAPSVRVGDEQNGLFSPAASNLGIATNGVERVRIDSNGQVGVAVTPSGWSTSFRALEIGRLGSALWSATGAEYLALSSNNYWDGTNFKYANTARAALFEISAGVFTAYSAASGTAGNNITWTQVLSVDKDKTLALQGAAVQTGTGITFPATQSASSNANTLDDYKEATWTPTVTAAVGSFTTVSATGTYVKVGRKVTFSLTITITTAGTAADILRATLPITNGSARSACAAGEWTGLGVSCNAVITASGTTVDIVKYDGTTIIANGRSIDVSGSYFV